MRPTAFVSAVLLAASFAGSVTSSAAAVADGPPTQPGAVTVTGLTATTADLSWRGSADTLGIEGYEIFRQAGSGPSTLIGTTDGSSRHYAARHLYAAATYTFRIVAMDTKLRTSTPRAVNLTTKTLSDHIAPAPPSSRSVAVHPFSGTRMDITWGGAASPDVAGYLVLRDGVVVGRVDLPGGLRFSDNGLAPGSRHSYSIRAIDSARNRSAATAPRTATTLPRGTVRIARGPYLSVVSRTTAVVSWWTNIPSAGIVRYGVRALSQHTVHDLHGSVRHHQVRLTGLTAGTAYRYTVGNGSVASPPGTLRTAALPGRTFSFAAIGDFGGASPGEAQNAANIAAAGTSFVQTLGDNIYPSAGAPDPNFVTTYSDYDARFFKPFADAIRNQAFFPGIGNQEYYSQGKFWTTFPMPGSNGAWYAYNWGNAHIVVLDTELSVAPGSPQYVFAQRNLATHQNAKWRIVITQRPAYSSTSSHSSSRPVRQSLVPLFQKYHVQLVLSGNSHNYERSYPLRAGKRTANGVTYVVSGGGGNGHNKFSIPQPWWSAHRDAVNYEYTRVTVSPTALTVAEIAATNRAVLDSVVIR
jgi:hypothetical protein